MQPEARISRAIISHIKARGGYAYKVHGGPTQPAGLPDISAVYRGVSLWFETKMPGKVPTAIQLHRHAELREVGAVVEVVHSLAEARAELDHIDTALDSGTAPTAISAALNREHAVAATKKPRRSGASG
jgi:hypothetical protein